MTDDIPRTLTSLAARRIGAAEWSPLPNAMAVADAELAVAQGRAERVIAKTKRTEIYQIRALYRA